MISLQKFGRDDYKTLISWIGTEEELMQFAGPGFSFPITNEQLDISLGDTNRFVFKVIELVSYSTIGHAEVYVRDENTYLARILIGEKSHRRKGYGQALINRLLDFVFTELKSPDVQLNVFDWNKSAIRCYHQAGFVINPAKTLERTVNGKIWTAINMRVERSNWLSKANSVNQLANE